MKNLFLIICLFIFFSACNKSNSFNNAKGVWLFTDINDKTEQNSQLTSYGDIEFVTLKGSENSESKRRNGDGSVVYLRNGWFDAGLGINEELNLEAVRVIRNLKKFEPGRYDGDNIKVYYIVPVGFRLGYYFR